MTDYGTVTVIYITAPIVLFNFIFKRKMTLKQLHFCNSIFRYSLPSLYYILDGLAKLFYQYWLLTWFDCTMITLV